MEKEIVQLKSIFDKSQTFVITTHINPDGDAIGSETALARFLADAGKQVHVLNHSETPDNLLFLNDIFPVRQYDPAEHARLIIDADCFIVVDTNATLRFKSLLGAFERSTARKIIIDHHLEHEAFADLNLIDTSAPATCELLYTILHSIDERGITTSVATALYTGIMTDTQSFKLPLTDATTHLITADLLQRGARPYEIYQNIYESGPHNKLQLLGRALNSITLHHNGAVAIMTLPRKLFTETDTKESDVDNLTQYVLSIQGVKIGIVITELEEGVKLSFRSKGEIPINELAKQYGGGGHRNAAGARVDESDIRSLTDNVLNNVAQYL